MCVELGGPAAPADQPLPRRLFSSEMRYLASTFLSNLGAGLMLTVQAFFVTQNLKISPVHFGFVLTFGAVLGLFAGVVLGKWSDGRDLRRLMPAFGVFQAITIAGYLVANSVLLLGVVVGLAAVASRGGAAVRGPFMAAMVGRERLVTYRAKVRSVANAAMAIGAALGGVALGFGSPLAVAIAMGLVPVGYLLGAMLTASVTLPHAGARRSGSKAAAKAAAAPGSFSVPVAKNPRFLVVVGLNAILLAHVPLLSVAFPLWISGRTSAPNYLISVVVLINTIGVLLVQVPMSAFVKTPQDAARACLGTGITLAASALLLAHSSNLVGLMQIAVLVLASLLHLVSEVWHSAASWELAFELAPEDRLGEYQGAFNSGMDLSLMIGPAVFGMLVAAPSLTGWWFLAGTLVLAGGLMSVAVRRAIPPAAADPNVGTQEGEHRE